MKPKLHYINPSVNAAKILYIASGDEVTSGDRWILWGSNFRWESNFRWDKSLHTWIRLRQHKITFFLYWSSTRTLSALIDHFDKKKLNLMFFFKRNWNENLHANTWYFFANLCIYFNAIFEVYVTNDYIKKDIKYNIYEVIVHQLYLYIHVYFFW